MSSDQESGSHASLTTTATGLFTLSPTPSGGSDLPALAGLTDRARWLLNACTILEQPFTAEQLAAVLGASPPDVLPVLHEVLQAGALVDEGGRFRFRSDRLRARLSGALTIGVREALRSAARGGGTGPGPDPAIDTLLTLTEEMKATAPRTAADLTVHLLSLLPADDRRRPGLGAQAVRLLALSGRSAEGTRLGDELLQSPLPPTASGEVYLALADTAYMHGHADDAVAYSAKALALPGLPPQTLARIRSIRAHGLLDTAPGEEAVHDADALSCRAVDGAARTGDLVSLVCGYSSRCRSSLELGDIEASVRFGTTAVRIADESGGQAGHRHPRLWLAAAYTAADRTAEALDTLTADREELERFGTSWSQPLWHLRLAELAVRSGDLDQARLEAELGARALGGRRGSPHGVRLELVHAAVALHRGDLERAGGHIADAEAGAASGRFSPPADLPWLRAQHTEAVAGPGGALAQIAETARDRGRLRRLLVRHPDAAARIAVWARGHGPHGLAEAVAAQARALADRNPQVELFTAAALHAEGVVGGSAASLRDAVEAYARGSRVLAMAGAVYDLAALETGAAGAAPRTGAAPAGTAALVEEAVAATAAVGAEAQGARLRPLLELLRAEADASGPDPSGLTGSEMRVARLVAEGLTNREVAARLHLSPHTVDSHLRHSFTKLDISSRVELTRWVLANDGNARARLRPAAPEGGLGANAG
ncbi:LuxR C-terminal-related transcriptional regulator [Nocardiopsis sp. RSe5-2]|uniref:LuxR C-terminal-related transcriptional regulator n=1 Tax=Nocardiopsis endophytica TaxID=3018445 RepID=A0ABT4U382_9ACTN|nr:LuxR family transcriptional regulator [Nocardiopsis endophytica]MDA2811419.1 LuxR C-terminal-related transcriptional regulator [Nocardiopsis endophytica]